MTDKLDVRSAFRLNTDGNYDLLMAIWPIVTSPQNTPLDLDIITKVMQMSDDRQLLITERGLQIDGQALIARVLYDQQSPKAEESLTLYAPVYKEGDVIKEAAPVFFDKGQRLDFAMIVNFGCCSKGALALVAMFHANDKFFVVQRSAANVELDKRNFFPEMYQDEMHTPTGSHIAMHMFGQRHDCGHAAKHDALSKRSPA